MSDLDLLRVRARGLERVWSYSEREKYEPYNVWLAADESLLLVCEYGEQGEDAEIVVYKRRDS